MSKSLNTRAGRRVALPTAREDEQINAHIKDDPANPEWSEADFSRARTAKEGLPPALYEKLIDMNRRAGVRGAQKAPVKEFTGIRFDPDVLAALRASGKGWQTRVNDIVRKAVLG